MYKGAKFNQMAKYKVLYTGSGTTTVNGHYLFTLTQGNIVDGEASSDGASVMVSLPYLSAGQVEPPIAKFKAEYLELVKEPVAEPVPVTAPVQVVVVAAPAPIIAPVTAKSASVSTTVQPKPQQTNIEIMESKVAKVLESPYLGIGVGCLIGAVGGFFYVENKSQSYIKDAVWITIFTAVGGLAGIAVMKTVFKKDSTPAPAAKAAPKSEVASAPVVPTVVKADDSKLNSLMDSVVSKNIKSAPVNAGNVDKVKAAIAKDLSGKEKAILLEMLLAFDKLPANPTQEQLASVYPDLSSLTTKYGADLAALSKKVNDITASVK